MADLIMEVITSVIDFLIVCVIQFLLSIIETIGNLLLGAMSIDVSTLYNYGFLEGFEFFNEGITVIATTMASIFIMWQLFTIVTGPLTGQKQASSVGNIFMKAIIFIPLTVIAKDLALFSLSVFQDIYVDMITAYTSTHGGTALIDLQQIYSVFSDGMSRIGRSAGSAVTDPTVNTAVYDLIDKLINQIIAAVFILASAVNFVKFIFEMCQRFVVMIIYVYLSPLAAACGVGNSTGEIPKKGLNLFISSGVLWVLNAWCVYIGISLYRADFLADLRRGSGAGISNILLIWAIIVYGYMKAIQKLDDIFNKVGAGNITLRGDVLGDMMTGFGIGKAAVRVGGAAVAPVAATVKKAVVPSDEKSNFGGTKNGIVAGQKAQTSGTDSTVSAQSNVAPKSGYSSQVAGISQNSPNPEEYRENKRAKPQVKMDFVDFAGETKTATITETGRRTNSAGQAVKSFELKTPDNRSMSIDAPADFDEVKVANVIAGNAEEKDVDRYLKHGGKEVDAIQAGIFFDPQANKQVKIEGIGYDKEPKSVPPVIDDFDGATFG